MDIPTVVAMENLFSEYCITPAKYHGGKLNGVDCHEVMSHAKILFEKLRHCCFLFCILTGAMMLKFIMCAALAETYLFLWTPLAPRFK
jgi:hypothetical protein